MVHQIAFVDSLVLVLVYLLAQINENRGEYCTLMIQIYFGPLLYNTSFGVGARN